MSAQIIDGKAMAATLRAELREAMKLRKQKGKKAPGLAVVLVGENSASLVYVKNKCDACEEVGFISHKIALPGDTPEETLLATIDALNEDDAIDGILVQLPLPAHINTDHVIDRINPKKDVDGFHPHNLGLLVQRRPFLQPCTPKGVITMLRQIGIDLAGKHAVVVGASNIVGRPMGLALLLEKCTTTICHRHTQNLAEIIRTADVLIVAIGKPKFIQGSWIKPGAVVIDIGINRLPDSRLVGDVDFESAKQVAGFITPVPGGVGPMTVATLQSILIVNLEFKQLFLDVLGFDLTNFVLALG